jgi:hypothetical protein
MQLILRQYLPLGRFHATPWRVNPYDDPAGEWPPSPWRFVRATVARWYQWSRETSDKPDLRQLDALVRTLCDSSYSFHLPISARRGSPLRQYHPVEFGWVPPPKKGKFVPRLRAYGTSLVQDNYWSLPRGDGGATWWFLDGGDWNPELLEVLDRCLERLIYYGRAEALTTIMRVEGPAPSPNCVLGRDRRSALSVRVLIPRAGASRSEVEQITDDPEAARSTVPTGATLVYAELPSRRPVIEKSASFESRPDCHLIQLAVGWNVLPEPRATVRLTARFRSAVLRELLLIKSDGQCGQWSAAAEPLRMAIADMVGKDARGNPLKGHKHTEFLTWWQDRVPTRILVWRSGRAFDADEQTAVRRAASRELSWAAAGRDTDDWKVRLIPLDEAVPPPPGFDRCRATTWESITPYVPPRHHLRGGKLRDAEAVPNQVRRELALRGIPNAESVEVEQIESADWVAVHLPRSSASRRPFLGDRLGYRLRLRFCEPVAGPLRLGNSSSFGLGLFKPLIGTSF